MTSLTPIAPHQAAATSDQPSTGTKKVYGNVWDTLFQTLHQRGKNAKVIGIILFEREGRADGRAAN